MIELKELDDLDISERMKEKLISKEIWRSQRGYLKDLKKNNPETYKKMLKKKREYLRNWRKKHPEKYKAYTKKYWLKKALSGESKGD